MDDEDNGIDVPRVDEGIGNIQILQASDMMQGETITLSLENAAQLILQHQGLQGDGEGRLQAGTYQIITQPDPATGNNQISIIQAGNVDHDGYEFGSSNMYLQQPDGDEDQAGPRIIHLPDALSSTALLSDQPHTILSVVQENSEDGPPEENTNVNQKDFEKHVENSLQMDLPSNQDGNVFEMINQPNVNSGENQLVREDGTLEFGNQAALTATQPENGTTDVHDWQTATIEEDNQTDDGVGIQKPHIIKIGVTDTGKDTLADSEETAVQETNTALTQTEVTTKAATGEVNDRKGLGSKRKLKIIKKPDLSKPIKVTDHMEVIVNGKKCLLKMNPDTGQMCAYPLISSSESGKPRGRPRRSESSKTQKVALGKDTDQANSAVEGLLELSNTGPDGIRRSARTKKKASALNDYDMLNVSSDDDAAADNAEDEVLPTGAVRKRRIMVKTENFTPLVPTVPGVKRPRGRPRRYPRPQETVTSSQIPAMIIPGVDGQTIMMAPIQGLTNLEAFQEQMRNLQILQQQQPEQLQQLQQQRLETVNDGTQFLNTPVTPVTILKSTDIPELDPSVQVLESTVDSTTVGNTLENTPDTNNISASDLIGTSTNSLTTSLATSLTPNLTLKPDPDPPIQEAVVEDTGTEATQPTIIQIPETLLPMFIQKKDPQRISMKTSDAQLEKFRCVKCNFQGFYAQQYQRHIATHSDDVIKCKCCPFLAFSQEDILEHFKQNHPRCYCDVCDHMVEHAYIMKRHMMRHNQIGCKCDFCGKVYKDQYVLKMHVKMVHFPAEVLFECTVCSKKFTRKAHLKRHLRIHEPEKPFKCPHCPYRGCEKSDISKHLLIHEEPKYSCEVCGKTFRHAKNKELHLKRHSGQRDYKCGVCDFYGYTFTDIRKHIERRHTDSKACIYACDKCGTTFKSESLFKEHKSQHCDVFMIEQALAITTTDGGTSQATIQIPSHYPLGTHQIPVDTQNLVVDNNEQITIENDGLPEDGMALTAEHLQAGVSQSHITDEGQSQEEYIQEMGEDRGQYTHVTDDVGLPGSDADMGADINEHDNEIDEPMEGIADDIVGGVEAVKPGVEMLQIVTGYDR